MCVAIVCSRYMQGNYWKLYIWKLYAPYHACRLTSGTTSIVTGMKVLTLLERTCLSNVHRMDLWLVSRAHMISPLKTECMLIFSSLYLKGLHYNVPHTCNVHIICDSEHITYYLVYHTLKFYICIQLDAYIAAYYYVCYITGYGSTLYIGIA